MVNCDLFPVAEVGERRDDGTEGSSQVLNTLKSCRYPVALCPVGVLLRRVTLANLGLSLHGLVRVKPFSSGKKKSPDGLR
jgi:hypothetical protein